MSVAERVSAGGAAAVDRVPIGCSPGFGIIDQPLDDLRRDLAGMAGLGLRRLRIDLCWDRIEPEPGRWAWEDTDRVLTEARAAGIEVLGILDYEPQWATRYDPDGRRRPVDPAGFAEFAAAVAGRYASYVSAWELWNEPNLRSYWGADPDPAAYAALVAATSPVLRRLAPGAPVVVGALAPAVDAADGTAVAPTTFLEGLYTTLGPAHHDAVSVHPYCHPAAPWEQQEWNTFHRLQAMHRTMARHGDAEKLIWLTEWGAPTGTAAVAVSVQRQAELVSAGIREARRRWYIGPLYLYGWRDLPGAADDPEAHFGVLDRDGAPKPVVAALRLELERTD